jgi:NADPH-dependent 2,4-dienoyl-CoA reductase/sulfur reductase-like enzyme
MRFVVIGGDAAGMSAASRAKRNAPDLDVVVLEQTHDVSYSACGMPYAIADSRRQLDELVVRRAEVFRQKQGIDLRTGHRVEDIDPGAKRVSGTTHKGQRFEVGFDKLLIATGASPMWTKACGPPARTSMPRAIVLTQRMSLRNKTCGSRWPCGPTGPAGLPPTT